MILVEIDINPSFNAGDSLLNYQKTRTSTRTFRETSPPFQISHPGRDGSPSGPFMRRMATGGLAGSFLHGNSPK